MSQGRNCRNEERARTVTAPTGPATPGNGTVAPPVAVSHVSKDYKDVPALTDVTFQVRRGSITGLLGHPESGKTTVLRTILGLVKPTSGEATVNGLPFGQLTRPARTVGAVLDLQSLHPHRTALTHLLIYTAAIDVPDDRAVQVLAEVGLAESAHHRAETLSPGSRLRLAIATALLGDPHILILDELFTDRPRDGFTLDDRAWLRAFLQNFAAAGGSVLVSSPRLHDVQDLVDHVVVLSQGSLAFQGSFDDLRRAQQDRLVIACSAPAALATGLAARGYIDARSLADGRLAVGGAPDDAVRASAQATGVTVYNVVRDRIDLDQLYLQIASGHFVAGASAASPAGYGVPAFGWPTPPPPPANQIQPPPGYPNHYPPHQQPPNRYPPHQHPQGMGGPR
ncbi:MAG: ATP-binding cassette domain-containing protein [Rhodococcus sp.]|nr:ATP-binding cassette domain-containing protein [Rhodococcus sp. (in: high G+C Gram-positive bacteria)]